MPSVPCCRRRACSDNTHGEWRRVKGHSQQITKETLMDASSPIFLLPLLIPPYSYPSSQNQEVSSQDSQEEESKQEEEKITSTVQIRSVLP